MVRGFSTRRGLSGEWLNTRFAAISCVAARPVRLSYVLGTPGPTALRAERVEYVAGHLLGHAAVPTRLLVREVRPDVSRTEAGVLRTLADAPRRITELAELEGLAQPTTTLLVQRLEQRGWVERKRDPGDSGAA